MLISLLLPYLQKGNNPQVRLPTYYLSVSYKKTCCTLSSSEVKEEVGFADIQRSHVSLEAQYRTKKLYLDQVVFLIDC